MKITFVLPMYLTVPAGGFKVVYEYANRLTSLGHEIVLIHPRNLEVKEYFKSYLWKYKQLVLNRPLINWFDLHPDVEARLTSDLSEKYIPDADCIIATAYTTAFYVANYTDTKGCKFYLIQHFENWMGSEEDVIQSWKLPLKKIVISKWLYRIAEQLDEVKNTQYIPNGLDFTHFNITKSITDRPPYKICMMVHPSEFKGTQDGLDTLRIVKKEIPDLEAILFGTEFEGGGLDISDSWMSYRQLPSQDELVGLYNSCSIFLHPSRVEGWGLPAAEAMACGCALISTDNDGVREFAIDNETALFAPVNKPEELAKRLIEALLDDDLRSRIAEAGNTHIKSFSWDLSVDKFQMYISDACSTAFRRACNNSNTRINMPA